MTLSRRLKKLEAGYRQRIVVYVPDDLRGPGREAIIKKYRRENDIPSEAQFVVLDEEDRGA